MSGSFQKVANNEKSFIVMMVPEFAGIDLADDAAVATATAAAVKRGAKQTDINSTAAAIKTYKENMNSYKEGQQ
jgi:hypothetical protein